MKTCPKCSKAHTKAGIYCSRPCANSRVFSEEAKKLKSQKQASILSKLTAEQRQNRRSAAGSASSKKAYSVRHDSDFQQLGRASQRRRVFEEQNESCLSCGIKDWQGKVLTFELDHINGINTDNRRSNLRMLCPNCHSQTSTWRGRNNTSIAQ